MTFVWTRPASISIHALREEGDGGLTMYCNKFFNFYPRPPRGGRLGAWPAWTMIELFLSTPSARRATKGVEQV